MNALTHPASAYARDVATLGWWMIGVAAVVWLIVVAMVLRTLGAPGTGNERAATRGVAIATAATVIILLAFMAYDFSVGRAYAQPHDPLQRGDALSVTVYARQWWWEFVYDDTVPTRRLSTANELHVPAGVPVLLALKAPDVIHSAWMPELGGKQDLTPGYVAALRFMADTPGVYKGVCAEFCGAQHANMRFLVIAQPRAEFERWRAHEAAPQPAVDSASREGQKVFLSSTCAACHTIGGTDARGTIGPILTHVGGRRTIAANTLPNTAQNLARWIRDPQKIKPGTQMPATDMPEAQLQSLVAYLRTLQ